MTRILYDAKAAAAGCVISRLFGTNPPVTNKSRLSLTLHASRGKRDYLLTETSIPQTL